MLIEPVRYSVSMVWVQNPSEEKHNKKKLSAEKSTSKAVG